MNIQLSKTATLAGALSIFSTAILSADEKPAPQKHDYTAAIEHISKLPVPPEGFRWAVNPDFTDEFEADKLDSSKWFQKSPYWVDGRPPATFKAENVSVEAGNLRIINTRLNPTEGRGGKPGDTYSYAGGAVASRSDQALYGYYETRMKASLSTMSSTFWLKNLPKEVSYVGENGKVITERHRQELDIIETVGAPTRFANWNMKFNANTHYQIHSNDIESPPSLQTPGPRGDESNIPPTADDFHTYGLWWVDAKTLHFYYDGKFLFTINPSTEYNTQPFSRSMYMHLVTETYDWEPGLPDDETLKDPAKNSTYYDWVRSYLLVRK